MPTVSADLEVAPNNSKVVKRPGSNAILATPAGQTVLADDDPANRLPTDFEIIKVDDGVLHTKLKRTDNTFVTTTATATTVEDVVADLVAFDEAYGPELPSE
jgi:hypothetical protein